MGSPDLWILDELFRGGEYKAVVESDLGDVRQIVDLGANAGISIRYWLNRWPDARVIGVEPDEFNFELAGLNARQLAETLQATGRGLKHSCASRAEFGERMGVAVRALCLPLRQG